MNNEQITEQGFIVIDGNVISEEQKNYICLVCHKPTKQPVCNECKLKHI